MKTGLVVDSLLLASLLSFVSGISCPLAALAGRGHGSSQDQVTIYAIESSQPEGLKLARGWISYNDGDVLSGIFRIYCPTTMIRPVQYVLKDRYGVIKREVSRSTLQAKMDVERRLVQYVCSQRILEDFDSLIDVLARCFVWDLDDILCEIPVILLSARCGSLRLNCL